MTIALGKLALISTGCLARVTRLGGTDGFDFDCENGAWRGYFSHVNQTVTCKNHPLGPEHATFPAEITSTQQPPDHIGRSYDGYNEIVPWMLAHPDKPEGSEQ